MAVGKLLVGSRGTSIGLVDTSVPLCPDIWKPLLVNMMFSLGYFFIRAEVLKSLWVAVGM